MSDWNFPEPHVLADAYYDALDAKAEAIYQRITCGECVHYCADPDHPESGICDLLLEDNYPADSWTNSETRIADAQYCSPGDPEPINERMLDD